MLYDVHPARKTRAIHPSLPSDLPAPAYWPPEAHQMLQAGSSEINRLPSEWMALEGSLHEMIALADAIRATQTLSGHFMNADAVIPLLKRSAELMNEISEELPDCTGDFVRARANGLLGKSGSRLLATPADFLNTSLLVHCGPLATWHSKTRSLLHSSFVAVPDRTSNLIVKSVDALLDLAGVGYLRSLTGRDDLEIPEAPVFLCASVLARGGEARTFPRHFAYFFPEDEGDYSFTESTVLLFVNAYRDRFEKISVPLARPILASPLRWAPTDLFRSVLPWFRGHDIAHNIRTANTDWKALERVLGPEAVRVLGEVVADVFGFLLTARGLVSKELSLDREATEYAFMAEMIHYLRRGPQWFADSAAAFFELSFLKQQGYVTVSSDGKLDWHGDGLHDGMVALGKVLIESVLIGNVGTVAALINHHCYSEGNSIADFVDRLGSHSSQVPTSFIQDAAPAALVA